MALHRILSLSIAVSLLPGYALAAGDEARGRDDAAEAAELDPAILGKVEGILDFCAAAGVQEAARQREHAPQWVGKSTPEQVEKARASSEYGDAYDEMRAALADIPGDQAQKACRELAVGR